jgi:translation initiation factor IF-3
VKRVRLIAPDGGQVGEKDIEEARWLAAQLGLDLVEVAPDARPPVVRMMDYGKYKYDLSVKARESRKKQTRNVVKEVQFRPKIGKADFDVKRKRVVKFLRQGDKVKCTMRFRGREVAHPELGRVILQRLFEEIEDYAEIETMPRLDGRNMVMVLAPGKNMPAADLDNDDDDDDLGLDGQYELDQHIESTDEPTEADRVQPEDVVAPAADGEEDSKTELIEPNETPVDEDDGEIAAENEESDDSVKAE